MPILLTFLKMYQRMCQLYIRQLLLTLLLMSRILYPALEYSLKTSLIKTRVDSPYTQTFPFLGGKSSGKLRSTNRPKEPNPLPKQGGLVPLSKPIGKSLSVPLVLHKPPAKAGAITKAPVVKTPATPKPGIESTVTVEPVPKTESAVLEQPKAKGEAVVVADPPKPKEEGAPAVEQPKAKTETAIQQHPPKAEAKAVEVTDQPKPEGQSKPSLSLAGIKGRLGFGPSKPEKPPPVSQDDSAQLEEDEEADVQAAIQESLKAPTSPQVQSGAQSSTSKPMTDLDQQESDLMTQLDKLMAETIRLETMTNPSIRDSSRMRSIEGVTQGIVRQLEEIAQQRSKSSPPALSSQTSKVQSATPIAAPPVLRPEVPSAQVKAVSPHRSKPLTIERLIQGMSGQQDPQAVLGGASQPAPPDIGVQHQPTTPSVRDPEPPRVRSRERTPARQPRSATPQKEAQPTLLAIEDGSPPKGESRQEPPRERERTPPKEHSRERRRRRRSPSTSRDRSSEKRQRSPTPTKDRSHRGTRRSPSPRRDHASEERQRSPTPPKERSHRRRRNSPSPLRDRTSEEHRHSPVSTREHRHDRRRRSPTPTQDRLSEERKPSPPPSREPSRERRRRRRSPEPSEISKEERRRSPSPTDDHPPKDDRPVVTQDRPARPRPRFDPAREHAAAQRVMDRRRVVQPPREHGADPGTDGPPDTEAEVRQRRKYPPPPPPASSIRQTHSGHRSLAFANPPPRRDSVTESSQLSERQPLRVRSHETPPQRPMPKRVVATSMVGSSAPPRLQDTSGRAYRGEYYDQAQVRDDRTYGSQHQQERQDWGSSQRRVPSMGRRESLHAWAGHQYSGQHYQDWSQQQPSTQEYWHDPQHDQPQRYPQQPSAQHWHAQQQQQLQQQLPALPKPVFPPGMQPSVQPPPGLGPNVQRTRQGVMSQGTSMQYGSAASRQQSPIGSQPPQDRQQSAYPQHYPSTSGYFRQGYQ